MRPFAVPHPLGGEVPAQGQPAAGCWLQRGKSARPAAVFGTLRSGDICLTSGGRHFIKRVQNQLIFSP